MAAPATISLDEFAKGTPVDSGDTISLDEFSKGTPVEPPHATPRPRLQTGGNIPFDASGFARPKGLPQGRPAQEPEYGIRGTDLKFKKVGPDLYEGSSPTLGHFKGSQKAVQVSAVAARELVREGIHKFWVHYDDKSGQVTITTNHGTFSGPLEKALSDHFNAAHPKPYVPLAQRGVKDEEDDILAATMRSRQRIAMNAESQAFAKLHPAFVKAHQIVDEVADSVENFRHNTAMTLLSSDPFEGPVTRKARDLAAEAGHQAVDAIEHPGETALTFIGTDLALMPVEMLGKAIARNIAAKMAGRQISKQIVDALARGATEEELLSGGVPKRYVQSAVRSPEFKSSQESSGLLKLLQQKRTAITPEPVAGSREAFISQHWRTRTQGLLSDVQRLIDEQKGAGRKYGPLKRELSASLSSGTPHPSITRELSDIYDAQRAEPALEPQPATRPKRQRGKTTPQQAQSAAEEFFPSSETPKPGTAPETANEGQQPPSPEGGPNQAATGTLETPKRADVAAVREAMGWDEYSTNHKSWDTEAEEWSKSKKDPIVIALEVNKKARALSASETFGLAAWLNTELEGMKTAKASGDSAAWQAHNETAHLLADALDSSGSEKGRALNAQKMVLKDSYDEFATTRRAEKSAGRELTDTEKQTLSNRAEQDSAKQAEIAKAEMNAQKKAAEAGMRNVPKSPPPSRRFLISEETYQAARERMRMRADIDPETGMPRGEQGLQSGPLSTDALKDMVQIGLYHVENGVRAVGDLFAKIKEESGAPDEHVWQATLATVENANRKYGAGRGFGEDILTEGKNAIQSSDIANLRKGIDAMTKEARLSGRTPDAGLIAKLKNQVKQLEGMSKKPLKLDEYKKLRDSIIETGKQLNQGRGEGEDILISGKAGIQDPEVARLRKELDIHRRGTDQAIANLERPNLKTLQGIGEWTRRFQHFNIFSSPGTLFKLASATVQSGSLDALGDVFGEGFSRVSGLGKRAGWEGAFGRVSTRAELDGVTAFLKSGPDVWDKVKTGLNSVDTANLDMASKVKAQGFWDFFGHVHGAMKTPLQRYAYNKSLTKYLQSAAKAGMDVQDPEVMQTIMAKSYNDSLEAIFQNDNKFTKALSSVSHTLDNSDNPVANLMGTLLHLTTPVTKAPTNIIGRSLESSFGLPVATLKAIKAQAGRLFGREITEQEAASIVKLAKRGGPGAVLFALGYSSPSWLQFGGYYSPGMKPGDIKPGHARIGGWDVPDWAIGLLHGPMAEPIQLGATFRHSVDQYKKTGEDPIGTVTFNTGYGLMENTPFLDTFLEGGRASTGKEAAGKFGANLVGSFTIPMLLQYIAKQTDNVPREQRGFREVYGGKIPGVRQTIKPKDDLFGNPSTPETDKDPVIKEMRAIGWAGLKFRRNPGESQADFDKRKSEKSAQAKKDVSDWLNDPKWKTMTKAQKLATVKNEVGQRDSSEEQ